MIADDSDKPFQRNIILTGATGYVGGYFAAFLIEKGYKPYFLGRPDLQVDRLEALPHLKGKIAAESILIHNGTVDTLAKAMSQLDSPVIVNLAGLFVSKHSSDDIRELIKSNIEYPTMLFDAMRVANIEAIVNVGTIWEHDVNGNYSPVNLYASMKQATAKILDYYVQSEGVSAITLKLLDTYGRNDPRKKLLPLLKQLSANGQTLDMTAGKQIINLCHIDDICCALMRCLESVSEKKHHNTAVFARTEESLSLRELIELIVRVSGRKLNINWGAKPEHPRQQYDYWRNAPVPEGWKQQVSLEAGLRQYFGNAGTDDF